MANPKTKWFLNNVMQNYDQEANEAREQRDQVENALFGFIQKEIVKPPIEVAVAAIRHGKKSLEYRA